MPNYPTKKSIANDYEFQFLIMKYEIKAYLLLYIMYALFFF